MADQIDISNVKTMGQFRTAIEEYVQKKIEGALSGYHAETTVNALSDQGSNVAIPHLVKLDLSGIIFNKHYGIINIVSKDATSSSYRTTLAPQAQIFVWWGKDGKMKYSITRNNLMGVVPNTVSSTDEYRNQYIQKDVSYDADTKTLSFTIINAPTSNARSLYGSIFNIDYHIW